MQDARRLEQQLRETQSSQYASLVAQHKEELDRLRAGHNDELQQQLKGVRAELERSAAEDLAAVKAQLMLESDTRAAELEALLASRDSAASQKLSNAAATHQKLVARLEHRAQDAEKAALKQQVVWTSYSTLTRRPRPSYTGHRHEWLNMSNTLRRCSASLSPRWQSTWRLAVSHYLPFRTLVIVWKVWLDA